MKDLAQNIKFYRKKSKLTQKELAELLNIAPTAISAWEVGRNKPLMNNIEHMATIFKIKKSELLGESEFSIKPSTLTEITNTSSELTEDRQLVVLDTAKTQLNEQLEAQEKQADNNVDEIHETLYPYTITEKIAAASGLPHGYSYDQDQNETFTLYSDKYITKAYDIASQVTGDSMEPNYHDGDVVLIKKGYDNINGSIYVVDYDGKTYLKKLYLEENHFRLVSINNTYDDIIIDLPVDESLYFNIVGKVVDSFTPVEV